MQPDMIVYQINNICMSAEYVTKLTQQYTNRVSLTVKLKKHSYLWPSSDKVKSSFDWLCWLTTVTAAKT